jgi:hypothetical protein
MLLELPHEGKSYLAELIQRDINRREALLLDMPIAYIVPFKNATCKTLEMLHIPVQESWLQTSY